MAGRPAAPGGHDDRPQSISHEASRGKEAETPPSSGGVFNPCQTSFAIEQQTVNGETRWVRKYTSNEANQLPVSTLKTDPVFHLHPAEMDSATISQDSINELFAKGIPALSSPCGVKAVIGVTSVNMDSFIQKKEGPEPAAFEPIWGRENGLWLHSDIKNMAFFYNYEFFYSVLNEE